MGDWGTWAFVGAALYFAYTSDLKGQSRSVLLWVCFWGIGVFSALNTWRTYQEGLSYRHLDLGPAGPALLRRNDHLVWLCLAETVIILVLPVTWYYRDRRKNLIAGGASAV